MKEYVRKGFEAWASDNGKWPKAIERNSKGDYLLSTTSVQWNAWLAAVDYLSEAIGAGGVSGQRITGGRQRGGEPVAWRPIETAPHNAPVLLGWKDWDGAWMAEVSPATWGWRTDSVSNISQHGQATHWMPLPSSPQPAEPVVKESLSVADGWQLVPKYPTSKQICHMAMRITGADEGGWYRTDRGDWPECVEKAEQAYQQALENAPKFGEEK